MHAAPPAVPALPAANWQVVRLLADAGAQMDWGDAAGQTALMHCAKVGFASVAEVLLR